MNKKSDNVAQLPSKCDGVSWAGYEFVGCAECPWEDDEQLPQVEDYGREWTEYFIIV